MLRAASALLALLCSTLAYALPGACQTLAMQVRSQLPAAGLIASWPDSTEPALRDVAFTYDNALAVLALTGCGEPQLANHIAAGLLYAQNHDRFWHDGRLRNGYAAGPLTTGTAKLGGWWSPEKRKWLEDGYQAGSDSGNQAFALLALLAAAKNSFDPAYLQAATRLGTWLTAQLDARNGSGYVGGVAGHEPKPLAQTWKSTEHNADLYAAFVQLAEQTHQYGWQQAADHARTFIESMWTASCGCFAVGTLADGVTPNTMRALDAQILPMLVLPGATARYAAALSSVRGSLAAQPGGFRYSDSPGSLWVEGTAQVALLLRLSSSSGISVSSGNGSAAAEADALRLLIGQYRDAEGRFYASAPGGTGTGFAIEGVPGKQRMYQHEPHLAALAWAAMEERSFNPFVLGAHLP